MSRFLVALWIASSCIVHSNAHAQSRTIVGQFISSCFWGNGVGNVLGGVVTTGIGASGCAAAGAAQVPSFFHTCFDAFGFVTYNYFGYATSPTSAAISRAVTSFTGPSGGGRSCDTLGGGVIFTAVVQDSNNVVCPDGTSSTGTSCVAQLTVEDASKVPGQPTYCAGNPCDPASGNKFQVETDYVGAGVFPIEFKRFHNSRKVVSAPATLGPAWTHSYSGYVRTYQTPSLQTAYVVRPDGKTLYFNSTSPSGPWASDGDVSHSLVQFSQSGASKWRLTSSDGDEQDIYDVASGRLEQLASRAGAFQTLQYDSVGRLQTVTDFLGRSLGFAHDGYNRIVAVTDPVSNQIAYTYDAIGNLSNVSWTGAGGGSRTYRYENAAFPHALTSVQDENSEIFASWTYDASGRATSSQHAGGAERITLAYPDTNTTVLTRFVDADVSSTVTYTFDTVLGLKRLTGIDGPPCPSCGPASASNDANGNVDSITDWNGNRTNYAYDLARNLETSRTEGLTTAGAVTPQTRTISTQWDTNFRLPTVVAEPLRITTNVYDPDGTLCGARGALCSRTIQATTDANGSQGLSPTVTGSPRVWAYTYNTNGSPLTVDGPRAGNADRTTYSYYANDDTDLGKRGNLATIANAAGHLTRVVSYNAHGQPLTIIDPNGITTTLTYDARQRLTSRTVDAETTSYEYDGVGQLIKVTLPDGSFLSYSYDAAHRMTGIQDNLGNRIAYTLDAMGNRTAEQVRDPVNNLAQTRSRVFNSLNRLFQEIGAAAQVTEYAYDNQGNVTSVKDPLNKVTSNAYDALNRLRQVTDPALGVTQYAYNGLDALTQVTDPRGLATRYTVDGLGNLTLQQSPDTGNTSNTYDEAGNLLTQTDAKGQVTSYAYDALNRVALITFHDGSKQAYAYDQGLNGVGRLSSITETDAGNAVTSVIAYAYDSLGRVTSETRTLGGQSYVTAYSYDGFGRMNGMTYPSGRSLAYGFDELGRVNLVSTTKNGQTQVVVQGVAYHPFGGVTGFTFGNGQVYARSVDQDGRIASYTLGVQNYGIGYDLASRITFISELGNLDNTNTYGYDALDRLTSATLPATGFAYGYDAVGNRTSRSVGAGTDAYAYSATSNRIASVTPTSGPVRNFAFDPNGSTLADGLNTYAYDARGRMVQAVSGLGTTSYQVNALGQRVRKTNTSGDTVFHYDTRGRLIAESDPGGAVRREYIYLGDIPVGVVQ
jgi:YD repeat-containing protein